MPVATDRPTTAVGAEVSPWVTDAGLEEAATPGERRRRRGRRTRRCRRWWPWRPSPPWNRPGRPTRSRGRGDSEKPLLLPPLPSPAYGTQASVRAGPLGVISPHVGRGSALPPHGWSRSTDRKARRPTPFRA
ncbi:hypothetical protein Shyhy01_36200 [Streptomyces hygroscopicus subsp. hygroscopicus]|nr:hypothetical protein Shyhy01_36200 [Streptomyces hygroscopicus subsp. hygroscopicus]